MVAALAACQGASRESVAAAYSALAAAANSASEPLIMTLASTTEPAARAPILRGLADVEKTFADGLAALQASGDVKAAADEVVRLARQRQAAFLAAAQATGADQTAALAPVLGEGGAAFHAAVERLRAALGLPPAEATPSPSASRHAAPAPAPGTVTRARAAATGEGWG